MRKLYGVGAVLVFALGFATVSAQEATPEATADAGAGEALIEMPAEYLSLDGMIVVPRVVSPGPGFITFHPDMGGGMPGPTTGVAPVAAGENANVAVLIDPLGSMPNMLAVLHQDTGTPGVYEFEMRQAADPMLPETMTPFTLTAIRAFDQQPAENNVIIGSVISPNGGWLVIHADDGGAPGPVIGQALLRPGTNPAVIVPIDPAGQTTTLFPMIHVDDNTVGEYEFGQVEGADNPVAINDQVAVTAFNLSETPVVLTMAGLPLAAGTETVPAMFVSQQMLEGVGGEGEPETAPVFTVDSILSSGPGVIDVHADAGGHPGRSLGHQLVNDGENSGVQVTLDQMMTAMPGPIPPTVWPMLHTDDNQVGVYEYLMIPGADLPVVVNGTVVTLPVTIGDPAMMATDEAAMGEGEMMATEEAGMAEGDMAATAEATPGS